MPTVLVTGASRGIGRAFVRQYADAGWRVIPTCRDPVASGLGSDCLPLDVADPESVAQLGRTLRDEAIDLLINNAGIAGPRGNSVGAIPFDAWAQVLQVNTLGPLRVAEALLEPVARSQGRCMVFISSMMGSIAQNAGGDYYPYRTSKAALNMAVRSLAGDVAPRGIACVTFHPGWVRTDMGGPSAPVDADTSVRGMRKVIAGWSIDRSGDFVDYRGRTLPW